MKVKYYEVHDCDFEYVDNISAIIAPEDTDKELLKKYDFVQLLDGRWCHYMTLDEKLHMINHEGDEILIFNEENRIIIRESSDDNEPVERDAPAAYIIVILSVFSIIIGLMSFHFSEGAAQSLIPFFAGIIALFAVRIVFPGNKPAEIITKTLSVLFVILFIGLVILAYAISKACNNCWDYSWDTLEGVGRIG